MADPLWTGLRLLHIGAGIALVGGATLWSILQPLFGQMGPTLPRGFLPTVGGKVLRVLPNAALVTLVTGVPLYYLMMPFASDAWRLLMGAALVLMLVALGLSFGIVVPTFKKLVRAIGALQGPPGPEVVALQARMKMASMANLAAAWTIVVLMVVATALRTT